MTSTGQTPQEANGESGSEPEKKPEAESRSVPLGEFIEMRKELRSALDELKELKGSAATKKSEVSAAPKTPSNIEELSKQVQQIAIDQKLRSVKEELGLHTHKQAEAVAKLLTELPSLTPDEALILLAKRDPQMFAVDGQVAEGQKANFGSLTPRPGSAPEPVKEDDYEERLKVTKQLRTVNRKASVQLANNMAGKFLADALGWEHKMLPLPKQ